ncbi:unnamed protein product [Macrosiphum euphorbiae]|uniref:Uncharacterized protein n=1 Tax=Macrosiphum euphorbiae TaxID=13131 RepID=A0AAV0W7S4_9HEMI|nr:unnamed protein product [Macrosiphum euphorbiae]
MAMTKIDIDAILRELINTLKLIDEFTVDEADEGHHFENQDGIDNENYQEHIDKKEVPEEMSEKKDPEVVNTLLGEMVEAVCDEVT